MVYKLFDSSGAAFRACNTGNACTSQLLAFSRALKVAILLQENKPLTLSISGTRSLNSL